LIEDDLRKLVPHLWRGKTAGSRANEPLTPAPSPCCWKTLGYRRS